MDMGGDDEMEESSSGSAKKDTGAKEIPMDFQMQLGKVVDQYLLLKDAFVSSDEASVEAAAKKHWRPLTKWT